jgi:ligand-binding SRPBCC domain-containing protein
MAVIRIERPVYFRDVMTAGAFKSFAHDHRFEDRSGPTKMTDEVVFRSPLGPLGWLFDHLFMTFALLANLYVAKAASLTKLAVVS